MNLFKYNVGADGDLNVPVSILERDGEEWAIVRDNGVGTRGFDTEEEARVWADENVRKDSAYLVRINTSVKQIGRL